MPGVLACFVGGVNRANRGANPRMVRFAYPTGFPGPAAGNPAVGRAGVAGFDAE